MTRLFSRRQRPSLPAPTRSPVLKAILMVIGAVTLFVLLDATVSHLGKTYPVPLLVWARYAVHCLLMVVLLAPNMRMRLISTARPLRQIVCALCLVATSFLGMAAFIRMPLAETTALIFMSPLIVTLLAGPVLGERISVLRWAAAVGGFIGVLLIARPGSGLALEGVVFAVGAAVMYAAYQILTRQLSGTENPVTMLFYTAMVGTVVMSLALPWIWSGTVPGWVDGVLIGSLGVLGGVGHYLLILAFRQVPASLLSPMLYAQLVIATLVGALLFGHIPDLPALVGILVISAAGAVIAINGRR
ncbi:MAG TPA: DMT family transporter [Azoarcus taiwanensis]|nr:DMT family transporter [Azoarcus taiwanensis]